MFLPRPFGEIVAKGGHAIFRVISEVELGEDSREPPSEVLAPRKKGIRRKGKRPFELVRFRLDAAPLAFLQRL